MVEHRVLQGSMFSSVFFLIYINDLTPPLQPILFTDDASMIMYHLGSDHFQDFIMMPLPS